MGNCAGIGAPQRADARQDYRNQVSRINRNSPLKSRLSKSTSKATPFFQEQNPLYHRKSIYQGNPEKSNLGKSTINDHLIKSIFDKNLKVQETPIRETGREMNHSPIVDLIKQNEEEDHDYSKSICYYDNIAEIRSNSKNPVENNQPSKMLRDIINRTESKRNLLAEVNSDVKKYNLYQEESNINISQEEAKYQIKQNLVQEQPVQQKVYKTSEFEINLKTRPLSLKRNNSKSDYFQGPSEIVAPLGQTTDIYASGISDFNGFNTTLKSSRQNHHNRKTDQKLYAIQEMLEDHCSVPNYLGSDEADAIVTNNDCLKFIPSRLPSVPLLNLEKHLKNLNQAQ